MKELVYPILTKVLMGVLQLVIIVVCTYGMTVINKAKKRLVEKIGQDNFDHAAKITKMLALWVEQEFPQYEGEAKYNKVVEEVNKKLGNILSEDEIHQLIEAAVSEMNLMKKYSQQQKALPLPIEEPQECEKIPIAEINPEGQITNTESL